MFRQLMSISLCSAALHGSTCYAQDFRFLGSGGLGVGSAYVRAYNPEARVSFSGTVTGITTAPPQAGTGETTQLIVRARNGGSMLVDLGPAWFVNHQGTKLKVGDRVTIVGSKVILDGRGSVYAQHVIKGNNLLALRNPAGQPYWATTGPAIAWTGGAAAQPMAATQRPQPVQTLGFGQQGPVTAFPAIINGAFQGFEVRGEDVFMHLDTGTSGVRLVHLGPTWFVERQEIQLEPGQIITVNALAPATGEGIAFAQQLTANANTLTLRGPTGNVLWWPTWPGGQIAPTTWQPVAGGVAMPRVSPARP